MRAPAVSSLFGMLTLLIATSAAQAQLKIAVIDSQAIISESRAGQAALSELESYQQELKVRLEAEQEELRQLQTRLSEGQMSLSSEQLDSLRTELETRSQAFGRQAEEANREMQRRQEQLLKSVEAKVMPVIDQLGAEGGYTLIFRKFESGLIYADQEVDITREVIARLDASE